MKNRILSIIGFFILVLFAFNGCKKGDTTPPEIKLNGRDTACVLNIGHYTELGATATDDKDGNITADIIRTGSINMNLAGSYTITYTVSDAAGNTNAIARTVIVYNQASLLLAGAGNYLSDGVVYNVKDSIVGSGAVVNYSQTVAFSNTVNNTVLFSLFANDSNNTKNVYATIATSTVSSTYTITIPSQTDTTIFPTTSQSHIFSGDGLIPAVNGSKLSLHFFDQNQSITPPGPVTTNEIYEWFN